MTSTNVTTRSTAPTSADVPLPVPASGRVRLSVPQASSYCGVSKSYMDKLRTTGNGPTFIRLGRRIVYDTADLDSWLESGRHKSTTELWESA
jgi:predicted DNA-binding transcriptional regulator AlpA